MFFTSDLRARGASKREIQKLRGAGTKVRRGVYVDEVQDPWQLFDLRCAATVRSVTGVKLAGAAAARQWGLPLPGDPPVVVHVRGVTRGRYGARVKVVSGADAQYTDHRGVPVTSVAWTVADCARLLSRRDALIVADAALHMGLCTMDELTQVLVALGRSKGVGRLRWIIANADPKSESAGETWMRMVVKDLGYSVASQHEVVAEGRRHRIDLLLEGTRVGLEFDGLLKYGACEEDRDPDKIARDITEEKRRQARIEGRGYQLLRVIWEQLAHPKELDRRIRYALGATPIRRLALPKSPW